VVQGDNRAIEGKTVMKQDAMKQEQVTKRRDFLKLAGLGTISGAAVAAAGASPAEAASEPPQGDGYRETAHVKKVYELSRF
jgi:hypothetical protein